MNKLSDINPAVDDEADISRQPETGSWGFQPRWVVFILILVPAFFA